MNKCICAKIDEGIDGMIKAVGTLRRKEFEILEVFMSEKNKETELKIVIEDSNDTNAEKALNHLKKIYGIREVKILFTGGN